MTMCYNFHSVHLHIDWSDWRFSLINHNESIKIFCKIANLWLELPSDLEFRDLIAFYIVRKDHKALFLWIDELCYCISSLFRYLDIEGSSLDWLPSTVQNLQMNLYLIGYRDINSDITLSIFIFSFVQLESKINFTCFASE